MGQGSIRVVVADDHDMVRRGIAAYLRSTPDIELVGEAGDGVRAVSLCAELNPDAILIDLVMPRMDGIEAIQQIHLKFPAIKIIALTSFQEKKLVQDALRSGAISYLLKNVSGRSWLVLSVQQS